MPNETNTIPTTSILDEVDPLSLQELFNHDPERYSQKLQSQGFSSIEEVVIMTMREHRARLEAAHAAGKKPRAVRVQEPQDKIGSATQEDFGLKPCTQTTQG